MPIFLSPSLGAYRHLVYICASTTWPFLFAFFVEAVLDCITCSFGRCLVDVNLIQNLVFRIANIAKHGCICVLEVPVV